MKRKQRTMIALNSGGFDSTVMLHILADIFTHAHIIALFFDYGQKNVEQERKSAKYNADKLGFEHMEIKLNPITWSAQNFYKEFSTDEAQYLEMRNLIFLSYALSVAQSKNASRIFLALIRNRSREIYLDTTEEFVDNFNTISMMCGVQTIAPFVRVYKEDFEVFLIANPDITEDTFFSCDLPVGGKPCGECVTCKGLKKMYENVLNYVDTKDE